MSLTLTRAEEAKIKRDRLRAQRAAKAKALRKPSEKRHRGRVRDNGYLAYLRRLPCCVRHLGGCDGPTEATHIRFADAGRAKPLTGLQTKPDDRWCLPACRAHHAAQHATNERAWWQAAGLDPLALAERLYAAYLAGDHGPDGASMRHGKHSGHPRIPQDSSAETKT